MQINLSRYAITGELMNNNVAQVCRMMLLFLIILYKVTIFQKMECSTCTTLKQRKKKRKKKYFLHVPTDVISLQLLPSKLLVYKKILHGLSPRANYTDRATAACRRSDCQLLRIEGATWSA
jgi:hypothetical protein